MSQQDKASRAQKPALTSNELAKRRTSMAAERSMMAADRSLMAWIRTGLSMIGFGFTIYKFLDGMNTSVGVVVEHSPTSVGMFLVGLGTLGVIAGTVEYWFHRKEILRYKQFAVWRPSFIMALLLSGGGFALLLSMLTKIG